MKKDVVIKYTDKKGRGLFANRNFKRGEVVVYGKLIKKVSKRTSHSFQMGPDFHVQLDKVARSINHSCDPDTGIRNNFHGGYNFIAFRNIKPGEEISWDYETSEYISIAVKECQCGQKNCRKRIKGFKYRSDLLIKKYGECIADYLKVLLCQRHFDIIKVNLYE